MERPPIHRRATSPITGDLAEAFQQVANAILPFVESLDRRFVAGLKRSGFNGLACSALGKMTAGAAALMLRDSGNVGDFLEQVEYNGRRLAKLNVPPDRAADALGQYDAQVLRIRPPGANLSRSIAQLRSSLLLTLNDAYYQVREAETEALFALFYSEVLSNSLPDLLKRLLAALQVYCRADDAGAYLLQNTNWLDSASPVLTRALRRPQCFQPARRNLAADPRWKDRYATCWSVPLFCRGRFAGVLQFAFRKDYAWLPREQEVLEAAAERSAMAMEKTRLLEDLSASDVKVRQLARRVIRAEEVERKRISRELHDETGQSLLCIRLQLEMLENTLASGESDARRLGAIRRRVRSTRQLAETAITEMRRLIAALSPSALELGLAAAIRQLITRLRAVFPGRVDLSVGSLGNVPEDVRIVAFRVIQEALNNVVKHSHANHVRLSLERVDRYLRIEVSDDGIGFDAGRVLSGDSSFGLHSLQERVSLLGGSLEIDSRKTPRRGTRIMIGLPLVLDTGTVFVESGNHDK